MALILRSSNKRTTQSNNDFTNEIQNVTDDYVKRTILERKQTIVSGTLSEANLLDSEILLNAPALYFKKYENVVQIVTSSIQDKMSRSEGQSEMIQAVKDDPTDIKNKERAFNIINSHFLNFDAETGNKEYRSFDQTDKTIVLALVVNEICGLGILEPLFRDVKIREIICNGPYDIQVEMKGVIRKVESISFRNSDHLQGLISKLFASVNKEVTRTSPLVRARLHDNSRLFAVHTAVAPDGPTLNIRRHPDSWFSPDRLVDYDSISEEAMEWIGQHLNAGCNILVAGGTATGKSLALDTKIPTPKGFKLLKDIEVNDIIFDKLGKPTTVLQLFDQKPRDEYKIHFNDGTHLIADLEHNWDVLIKGNSATLTTEEIINQLKQNNKVFIPITKPVEFNNALNLKLSPYSIGVLIGTNYHSSSMNKKISLEKMSKIQERMSKLSKLIAVNFSTLSITKDDMKGTLSFVSMKKNKSIEDLLRDDDLINDLNTFEISDDFIFTPIKTRIEFIAGLIDSCAEYNNENQYYRIKFLDKQMTDKVTSILTSIGCFVKKMKNNNIIFKIEHVDLENLKINNDYKKRLTKQIKKIEPTGKTSPMRCLQVDSPSKTFLAGSYHTVTHNTTLLSSLTGYYNNNERILTVERNIEMKVCPVKLVGPPMEEIPAKAGSKTEGVSMLDLVEATTQMRPDVIIVGEVTGPEAYAMLQALNTGHKGCCTIHANGPEEVVQRLTSLATQAGYITGESVYQLITSAFDIIVMVKRFQDGTRKIEGIYEVGMKAQLNESNVLTIPVIPIWKFEADDFSRHPNANVEGTWKKVGELSEERRERHNIGTVVKLKPYSELKKLYQIDNKGEN